MNKRQLGGEYEKLAAEYLRAQGYDINPKHLKALIALNKLFTIAQAWNKEDDFVPDFLDEDQYKWYPSFIYDKHTARYIYYRKLHTIKHTTCCSGARL